MAAAAVDIIILLASGDMRMIVDVVPVVLMARTWTYYLSIASAGVVLVVVVALCVWPFKVPSTSRERMPLMLSKDILINMQLGQEAAQQ